LWGQREKGMGYVGMGMKCAERRGDGLNHETPQNSDKHFQ